MSPTVLDDALIQRLSQKLDVGQVLRFLDAMPEEQLATLLRSTADGDGKP